MIGEARSRRARNQCVWMDCISNRSSECTVVWKSIPVFTGVVETVPGSPTTWCRGTASRLEHSCSSNSSTGFFSSKFQSLRVIDLPESPAPVWQKAPRALLCYGHNILFWNNMLLIFFLLLFWTTFDVWQTENILRESDDDTPALSSEKMILKIKWLKTASAFRLREVGGVFQNGHFIDP